MAAVEEKTGDFYAVLGLKKECSASELRNAYKKLALKWHPDRFSAPGDSRSVEDAKKNFQAIQEAYSVLSDANKRTMYDVGICDSDDDENGMNDFLSEMAAMMNQAKTNDSFEDLQKLFEEMFQRDTSNANGYYTSNMSSSSSINNGKRNSMNMNSADFSSFRHQQFSLGADDKKGSRSRGSGRRNGRKQKGSSSRNGMSCDTQISV